jgi:hypothetical protein
LPNVPIDRQWELIGVFSVVAKPTADVLFRNRENKMEIIQSQAQQQVARIEENFEEFTRRIERSSQKPLRYGDGRRIILKPGIEKCFLELDLLTKATPELFENLAAAMMLTVKQFEAQKLLPEDWVQGIGTPIDIATPAVPQHFIDEVEASGGTVKTYLNGNTYFDIVAEYPEPEMSGYETQ